MKIQAVALEQVVRLDGDKNVEIARRRAPRARFTLTREADSRPILDASRDVDIEGPRLGRPTAAAAGWAGILDDVACALTGRTGAFDREETLLGTNLARALARATGFRFRSVACSGAAAALAGHGRGHVDLGFAAFEGVLERNLQVVTEVGPSSAGAPGSPLAAHELTKQVVEDVGEGSAAEGKFETARPRSPGLIEGGMAELIVGGTLLPVGQNVVGFADFLEFLFGGSVIRILVRMVFHGQLSIGLLDVVR